MSTLPRQAQQKAAVHERRAAHFPPRVREPNSALEATVRYFHAMNYDAARDRQQPLHSGDEQRILLDRDLDILRFDAGERRLVSSRSLSNTSTGGSQFAAGARASPGRKN
jgi:hypothetical protein